MNLNSRLSVTLQPGSYTIEATTYKPATSGSFTLTIEGLGQIQSRMAHKVSSQLWAG